MKQFEYDDVHLLHREFARPVIYTNILILAIHQSKRYAIYGDFYLQ